MTDDARKVTITFLLNGNETKVTESVDADETNPIEILRGDGILF